MNDDIGNLIEPAPVTFTWEAPGWYVLGALVVLVIAGVIVLLYRHHQKNKYRGEALMWLSAREGDMMQQHPERLVYDATMLLKRIAMARYGRARAATHDREWIAFLNSVCKTPLFADRDAQWLMQVIYAPNAPVATSDVQAYLQKAKEWIKRHRYAL